MELVISLTLLVSRTFYSITVCIHRLTNIHNRLQKQWTFFWGAASTPTVVVAATAIAIATAIASAVTATA